MVSDPAIKLFGKTISITISSKDDSVSVHQIYSHKDAASNNQLFDEEDVKKSSRLKVMKHEIVGHEVSEKNIPCVNKVTSSPESERNAEESTETSNSEEKTLKKPDKIIQCPRCNSMDTKFCYYNNYNVNQPRHFCKNCQRYWTAGGTMRNVPVGAGRRKHKQATPNYRHIFHNPILVNNNGSVLNFEPDIPNCESKKNALYLQSNSSSSQEQVVVNLLPVPYFTGSPWTQSLGPSGFPVSYCPSTPTYWGYTVPPTPNFINNNILNSSSNLGKHSSDDAKENNLESGVWMPKTLRIGDPSEAAKSSIWETLGIKNDKTSSMNERGMFKTIKSKGDKGENHNGEPSSMLHVNPAAMSRSQNFHETT